jgi:hypothetical protein
MPSLLTIEPGGTERFDQKELVGKRSYCSKIKKLADPCAVCQPANDWCGNHPGHQAWLEAKADEVLREVEAEVKSLPLKGFGG